MTALRPGASPPPVDIAIRTAMGSADVAWSLLQEFDDLAGDSVSRSIVGEAPRYLRNGGLASILVSWIHAATANNWSAPLRDWVTESGCDAWFLRKGSYDPLAYAVLWNQRQNQ